MRSILKLFFFLILIAKLGIATIAYSSSPDSPVAENSEQVKPYQKLLDFTRLYPQQKVYLHTDKSEYLAGESIWFKAYLMSAHTHMPDTSSTNLFVELVNTRNEVVDFKIILLRDGFSNGDFQLSDSMPDGNYQIKAYTSWMNNFHRDFLFRKDIFVHNKQEVNYATSAEFRRNIRFNSSLFEKQEQMQFAFFPEGGNMLVGLENRVAFKAANDLGEGQQAKGVVVDSQGNEVAFFETIHDGMGYFFLNPEPSEKYSAQVVFSNGQRLSVGLPDALSQGYLLRVEPNAEVFRVKVLTNFDPESFGVLPEVTLLAHTRGKVYFIEKARLSDGTFSVDVLVEIFPEGITHFTLFGPNEIPVAERLVFVNKPFSTKVGSSLAFEQTISDSLVVVDFWFDAGRDHSLSQASYSLAVTEAHGHNDSYESNILTYLLLSSDFGKTIKNPWYYFSGVDEEKLKALDILMLTHGWRRFSWDNLLDGRFPEIKFNETRGLSIAGQVTPVSSSKPTGELNLELSVGYAENRRIINTKTDPEGYFAFTELFFENAFTGLLSVERDMRGRIYKVDLFGGTHRNSSFELNLNTRMHQNTIQGPDWQRRSRPGFFSRLFNREVPQRDTKSPSLFGTPDQVIYIEDLTVNYSNVLEILRDRVTGLAIIGGEITLRGPSSIMLSSEPMFFVDDVQVDRFGFLNIPVPEVERIAVLRGPSSAILGSRGGNGALLIYTRRASHMQQYSYEYQFMGYQVPREFFISRIEVRKFDESQVPRTILWAPNITPDVNGRVRVRIPYYNGGQDLRFRLEGIDRSGQITFLQF